MKKKIISTKLFLSLREALQKGIDIDAQVLESEYDEFAGLLFSETSLSQDKAKTLFIFHYTRVEFSVLQKNSRMQKKKCSDFSAKSYRACRYAN